MGPAPRRAVVVGALGTAQTLAWASSYYLPAILAAPMAASLGVPPSTVFGFFSASLLLTAFLGPWAGRLIDRRGGRGVLAASSLVLAGGLGALGLVPGFAGQAIGWALLGIGMALGLYDAAFATLAGLYGKEARGSITGITLIAGFASTVGWPLSALFLEMFGWQGACLAWAGLHLLLGLPLNRLLLPMAPPPPSTAPKAGGAPPIRQMLLLAWVFAVVGFTAAAIGAHLPGLLGAAGATVAAALAAAALVGPAQVGARVLEASVLRKFDPVRLTMLATATHPLAALLLMLFGAPVAALFTLLHGAGNGVLTIARGTLPLALFGPAGYGERQGWITAPARLLQAAAPLGFGLLIEQVGVQALWLTTLLGLSALAALWLLRR
ncbi:MFS transporter [Acetobacteraceae bacterium H6797]|nr:MFS transporter [Acetobacteraceae bacterium H6797]